MDLVALIEQAAQEAYYKPKSYTTITTLQNTVYGILADYADLHGMGDPPMVKLVQPLETEDVGVPVLLAIPSTLSVEWLVFLQEQAILV